MNDISDNREKLTRCPLNFMNQSSPRLFNIIAILDTFKASKAVKKSLESMSAACNTFQTFKSALKFFKESIPNDHLFFNQTISSDLVWRNQRSVLQVIDEPATSLMPVFSDQNQHKIFGTH